MRVLRPPTRVSVDCLSRDGGFALFTIGPKLCVWNLATDQSAELAVQPPRGTRPEGLSMCGTRLLVGYSDSTARVFSTNTGACIAVLTGHMHSVSACFISADGHRALTGDAEGGVRLWDVNGEFCLHEFQGHASQNTAVCLAHHADLAATASRAGYVCVWNLQTRACLHDLRMHQFAVNAVCFSPDDTKLGTASSDCSAGVWDVITGEYLREFKGHRVDVWGMQFFTVRQQLMCVTCYLDRTVRVWDYESRECVRVWEGHERDVTAVCVPPQTKKVLSASLDGTVREWELQSQSEKAMLSVQEALPQSALGKFWARDGDHAIAHRVMGFVGF